MAPSSMAWRTRARMASSWAGVGSTSSSPRTFTRVVSAPMKEARFMETPRFSMPDR